ncbi:hypothetical protein MMC07_000846 [Pseudocyphellaria aurata]|nr:hypothetical protein [Pseudocyphellaria aurata]
MKRPYKEAYKVVTVELAASTKESVKAQLAKMGKFIWGADAAERIRAVSDNVTEGAGPKDQYHLVMDASKFCAGGVLFQLKAQPPGTKAADQHRANIRVLTFILFRTEDLRSSTTTWLTVLNVIQCLFCLRCLLLGSKFPTRLYPDPSALESVLDDKLKDAHGRMARLTELNNSINAQALDLVREAEAGDRRG